MADVSNPASPPSGRTVPDSAIVFHGSPRNMVVGFTMVAAGLMAFVMGMTDVFFAEAMAWTFVIWGALFLFGDLLVSLQTWRVQDEALVIRSPGRFWRRTKVWEWDHIYRLDLIVKRADAKVEDIELQVYHTPAGDTMLEREDRMYSEELARLIIERSRLKPTHPHSPESFSEVLPAKATYTWNRSGKSVSS